MKILFSGYHNPHFITFTEYVEMAIKKLGHTLISFDDRQFIIPGRFREKIPFLHEWDLNRLNNKLISLAQSSKPELCIVTGGHRILPYAIKKIASWGIKTVLWTVDSPRTSDELLEVAKCYDFVFCSGTERIELFEKAGIKNVLWLPFACEPEIHKNIAVQNEEKKLYECDIAFVGSVHPQLYPFRVKTLESLTEFNLGIWGPGTEKIPVSSTLRKCIRGEKTTPDIWTKIYSASAIVLCLHYKDPNGKLPCYQASPRVFEALACRSFLITDDQKDIKRLFIDGKHLVVFKDTMELKEKVNFYLNHPEERERISEAGYKEVLEKHTYVHRIKEMFETIYSNNRN